MACTLAAMLSAFPARGRAESKQVFGIHSWDWGAHIDVMSNRTGWCVEANATATDSVDVNRHKWASGEGFTVLQRLDWKWEQTIPLTAAEQDEFAVQCGNWANAVKRYTRHYSIGNEVEFFDVTAPIYADCFRKVRAAIKAVQPEAVVIIGHMNSGQRQYETMMLLGPDGYDGVTAHAGSSVPADLFDYLDQAGARPGVGVYITEWGWVAGTNPNAMAVMAQFARDIGEWNASHERQVHCACWYLYPHYLHPVFSLALSPLDNAAFENATAMGLALSKLKDNPIVIENLVADVPDAGTVISLSWTTNVAAHAQLWWTRDGTWNWDNEKFTDRSVGMATSHQYAITGLSPSTTYEVMPNCTRNDYADAGGRRFHVTTGPWLSTVQQISDDPPAVRIRWHTDWPSDSRVEYGSTPELGSHAMVEDVVTDHQVDVQVPAVGTYYYRVISAEPLGDPQVGRLLVRSPVRTFVVEGQVYVRADLDRDGDVDQEDFGLFQACYTGAGIDVTDSACLYARLDGDGDVDEQDVALFIACYSGPNRDADPACEEGGSAP